MKAWNAANPRDRRAYKAAYDSANKEQIAAYRAKNRDKFIADKKAWYRANRARVLARVKAHAAANRERILAYQADYYAVNTDKVKANVSAYRKANPEKKRHLENKRRAKKASNGGSHTLEELIEKFERMGNVCFYCGEGRPLTIDHDIPLSRGGTDDISNILPSCRSCNSRKNKKTAVEFLSYFGGVSAER